jgi:hypothetical protein
MSKNLYERRKLRAQRPVPPQTHEWHKQRVLNLAIKFAKLNKPDGQMGVILRAGDLLTNAVEKMLAARKVEGRKTYRPGMVKTPGGGGALGREVEV